MSDKTLTLTVDFKGNDGLSKALRVITGVGNQAEASQRSLTRALRDQKAELKKLEMGMRDISKIGGPVDHLYRRQKTLKEQIAKTSAELKKQSQIVRDSAHYQQMGAEIRGSGYQTIATGVALAAPPSMAVREAAKFETAMAGTRKVLDGWSPEALKELNRDVLDLAGNIPLTHEELGRIVALGGQDGIGAELAKKGDFAGARAELKAFTEDAAKMGVAFDISAEDAGARMSSWRASMGINQAQAVQLADQINALSDSKGGGQAADISETVTRIGSIAKIGGIARQEVAAMASHLSGMKVAPEIAATGIKNMMFALTSGETATKSQLAAFDKIGLSAENVAKNMQVDAKGTILDVMGRIKNLSKDQQISTMETLFGREGLAAIAPMIGQLDELKGKFDFVGNSANFAGSMSKEFNNRNDTAENQAKLAMNEIRSLGIEMGSTLLPAVKMGAGAIKGFVGGIRDWTEKNPEATKTILKVAFAVSGLVIGLGAARVVFGAVYSTVGQFIGLGSKILGFGRIVMGLAMANPFMAIAIGIGIAVVLVIANWDKITGAVKKGWNWLKSLDMKQIGLNFVKGLAVGIMNGIPGLGSAINFVTNLMKNKPKEELKVKSPSRVAMEIGGFYSEGFGIGINQKAPFAAKAARNLSRNILKAGTIAAAMSGGAGFANASPAPIVIQKVEIVIQGANQNPTEIAAQVELALQRLAARAQTRQISSFDDV